MVNFRGHCRRVFKIGVECGKELGDVTASPSEKYSASDGLYPGNLTFYDNIVKIKGIMRLILLELA